jgi:hypothetical protein
MAAGCYNPPITQRGGDMIFIKTFKGYEDRTQQLDDEVNAWVAQNRVEAVDIKAVLSHEPGSRSGSGDLLYAVLYRAEKPVD